MSNNSVAASDRRGGKSPLNYSDLTRLAKRLRRPIKTLLVLDSGTDPFVADSVGLRGGPGRHAQAEWFARLWSALKIPHGAHQRRIHYAFVSQPEPIRMVNGRDYVNTQECLAILNRAARDARTLGLVPTDAIIDRRRSGYVERLLNSVPAALVWDNDSLEAIALPDDVPTPVLRLRARVVPQRCHLELWAEKSTMDDVLVPLAERYQLNVVSGAGEQTSFACRDLVDRAEDSGRPVRILYLSDFDPAGMGMPVAAARKIEHEIVRRGLSLDVQVQPVVLTHSQCVQYELPRTPIKEGDMRKAFFERRFGEGATELDALEALHPGLLRQILVREIERYWDSGVAGRVRIQASYAQDWFDSMRLEVLEGHPELAELTESYARIRDDLDDWRDRAAPVLEAIENQMLDRAKPYLEAIEWPEPALGDEMPDPLFDSRRDYLTQVDRYKRHQGRPTIRQPYGSGTAKAREGVEVQQ